MAVKPGDEGLSEAMSAFAGSVVEYAQTGDASTQAPDTLPSGRV